jgi:sialic acid synthase SpsE
MYGSDQAASIEPSRFRMLVGAVRKIHNAMGDGQIGFPITKEVPIARQLRAHIPCDASELNGVFGDKTDGT